MHTKLLFAFCERVRLGGKFLEPSFSFDMTFLSSLCFSCVLSCKLLAFMLVALAPVTTLAFDATVEALLALCASLMFDLVALGARAEAAEIEDGFGCV